MNVSTIFFLPDTVKIWRNEVQTVRNFLLIQFFTMDGTEALLTTKEDYSMRQGPQYQLFYDRRATHRPAHKEI